MQIAAAAFGSIPSQHQEVRWSGYVPLNASRCRTPRPDDPPPLARPPRVGILGGSVSYGRMEYGEDCSYSEILWRALNATVFNFAMPATGAAQASLCMGSWLPTEPPVDVLVLEFAINDALGLHSGVGRPRARDEQHVELLWEHRSSQHCLVALGRVPPGPHALHIRVTSNRTDAAPVTASRALREHAANQVQLCGVFEQVDSGIDVLL